MKTLALQALRDSIIDDFEETLLSARATEREAELPVIRTTLNGVLAEIDRRIAATVPMREAIERSWQWRHGTGEATCGLCGALVQDRALHLNWHLDGESSGK